MAKFDWKDPTTVPLDGRKLWLWLKRPGTQDEQSTDVIISAKMVPEGWVGAGDFIHTWNGDKFDGDLVAWDDHKEPNRSRRPFKPIPQPKGPKETWRKW